VARHRSKMFVIISWSSSAATFLISCRGRVSTETDARLSYDVEGSMKKGRRLIKLYEDRKIPRERVLIKIASTWEGLNAAEATAKRRDPLQFDADVFARASGARGRKRKCSLSRRLLGGFTIGTRENTSGTMLVRKDPGVQSVGEIYTYYKKFGIPTEVMGASFRNVGQIRNWLAATA